MDQLQNTIEEAFERRAEITPRNVEAKLKESVAQVLEMLDSGKLRVAEKVDGEWKTHQWIKKAVLFPFVSKTTVSSRVVFPIISIKCRPSLQITVPRISAMEAFASCRLQQCVKESFIASNVVLMPSYVNIGAYVDEGTMVDTWATVGSCAQIGKNVHLSGGVGIGGVLEPVRPIPPLSRTTALSARARKSLKALLSERIPSFRWAYISARAPKFITAKPVKSAMGVSRQAR